MSVPHICHPRMLRNVCVFTCVCVCMVTIWAEHQGHAWTARRASPLLICPAPSPHDGRSKPRQGQHRHPVTPTVGARVCVCAGGRWLSIIDGSWLWWTSSLCLGQRRWPIFHSRSSAELMCCVNACVNQEECSAARPPRS